MTRATRPTVLFVHGVYTLGGDTLALLRLLQHLDPDVVNPVVVAAPGSEALERVRNLSLAQDGRVRIYALDMGVNDHRSPQRSRLDRKVVLPAALLGLLRIARRESWLRRPRSRARSAAAGSRARWPALAVRAGRPGRRADPLREGHAGAVLGRHFDRRQATAVDNRHTLQRLPAPLTA